MNTGSLKHLLIEFLKSEESAITIEGMGVIGRGEAKERLCALIPTSIEVYRTCTMPRAAVTAAPHIHFDGWSGHFSRKAAEEFGLGWVVAKNFRDDDSLEIPVSIGRHLHVNRPTESSHRQGSERETPRAREAYVKYVKAIAQAGGKSLPVDILIEFHGHRRHKAVEIATTGVGVDLANSMHFVYRQSAEDYKSAPELRIEPLHLLNFSAYRAKQCGVMQSSISRMALHIEIPRELRLTEADRERAWGLLKPLIGYLLESHQ